jgi:hypothetical protein
LPIVGHVVALLAGMLSGLSLIGTVTAAWMLAEDLRANSGLSELCRSRPGIEIYLWLRILLLIGLHASLIAGCVGLLAQREWSRRVALLAAAALAGFAVIDPLILIPVQAPLLPWPTDDLWHHPLARVAVFDLSVRLFVLLCLWVALRDAAVRRALAVRGRT